MVFRSALRRGAGLAAAVFFLPAGASAQEPDLSRYTAMVAPCVAPAADAAARRACIGVASSACMDTEPGGQSTLGMMSCMLAERDGWDALLNSTYQAAMATAKAMDAEERANFPEFANRAETLRAAQRAWIAFRDADCANAYAEWGSGSMRQIAGADCLMTMTADRTLDLIDRTQFQ